MKSFAFFIIAAIVFASCSSSKETTSERLEKKAIEAELVKHAVESRQYVIRMDRMFAQGISTTNLVPKNNFFIMNGEIASVSLPYVGRSYFIRPISGINFNGQTTRYEMQSDSQKGVYNIQVEVEAAGNKFDFYINIGTSGSCSISLTNAHIQSISYQGQLVPLALQTDPSAVQKEKL
jgi:hypothetical protein